MKVWTIVNQKGGVGKTTTVASLATILVQRGQKVLMIDTDPHGSLGAHFGINESNVDYSIYDAFIDDITQAIDNVDSLILPSAVKNLDLLPASMALVTLDKTHGNTEGMGLVLKKMLKTVDNKYDFVLIDCSPVLGVLMVNAVAACDHLIIPVQTEFLAIKGLELMIKTMALMGRSLAIEYNYTLVPTMYDRRVKASIKTLQELSEHFGDKLWPDVIPIDTKFRDASLAKIPTPIYAPTSKGVKAYNHLLDFVMQGDFQHVKIS